MIIHVNKKMMECESGQSLAALIRTCQGQAKAECIASVNGQFVVFSKWSDTILQDGDEVEIIVISSGG